jgi:hypothetical protein
MDSGASSPADARPTEPRPPVHDDAYRSWAPTIFYIWIVGVLALGARWISQLVLGEIDCRRIRQREEPINQSELAKKANEIGLRSPPEGFYQDDLAAPAVHGIWKPIVLLPPQFFNWNEDQQRHILLHELSHIRQNDIAKLHIALLGTVFYWFNPIMWWAARRLQLEQERSCDDAVIRQGVKPSDYSETLLAVYESQRKTKPTAGTLAEIEEDDATKNARDRKKRRLFRDGTVRMLNERLLALIDPRYRRAACSKVGAAIVFVLVLFVGWQIATVDLLADWLEVSPRTLEVRVNTTSDDAEENRADGSLDMVSKDLEMPHDLGRRRQQFIGIRFTNIQVPRQAKILYAAIVFTADRQDVDRADLWIAAQLEPNPPSFRNKQFDISSRIGDDSTKVNWTKVPGWKTLEFSSNTTTPDLRHIIQPIVDSPHWTTGNSLVFVLGGEGEGVRSAVSFDTDQSESHMPVLRITYVDGVSKLLRPSRD